MVELHSIVRRYIGALVVGMLGVGLMLVAMHLWSDHENLHVLIQIEAARQAAQRAPAPAPGAPNAPR